MKIALAQTNIIWEDKDENIRKTSEIVASKASEGVDLVLFPEMSFTGFSMNTDATKEKDNQSIKRISAVAAENHVAVGFGWVKDCDGLCENHYTIVDDVGCILSDYAKIHPFSLSGEDKHFSGGQSVSVFEFHGIRMTSFICYDLRFPELFRLVCDDVSLIIVPANWPGSRSEHWKTLLRARAIENQVYVLGINCQGEMNGLYYSGDSSVIDPNGVVLQSLNDKTGVIVADIDGNTDEIRKGFPVLTDRKTELYYKLEQTDFAN